MASILNIGLVAAALLFLPAAVTGRAQADEGFRLWLAEFRPAAEADPDDRQ